MFVPEDISSFYSETNTECLFQGDIVSAEMIGLKDKDNSLSPDFWIVISKSCDLAFRDNQKVISKKIAALLPLISFSLLKKIFKRDVEKISSTLRNKVVLLALVDFTKATNSITKTDQIDNLIKDELSKFMFFPPDGTVLKEPMLVDFDIVERVSGITQDETAIILSSKLLQLSSPFREKFAQRFALHYMQIGIDDGEIREKSYKEKLKEHFKGLR